jgi:2-polyprenyl-3-methyl-5-hydroxy-6-metoxy-1,4-benzoquinol methylase
MNKVKQTEAETLATFQEELPSVYYSDKSDQEFHSYLENAEFTYRDCFKFPPEMFANKTLIDFGAGTGENTVYLARWGARCTLVEMNPGALKIASEVFRRYSQAPEGTHRFVNSSIFDFEESGLYDIVHSRGVLSHTAAKEEAFGRIADRVRPGGYLIFGDPNKAGGFQNMLQRHIIYRFATTKEDMTILAERLFKYDIDRSQRIIPRTRKSIIFDRWVIQQQDDPSVDEVFSWFRSAGLKIYGTYPPVFPPLIGDSVHHQPKFDWASVPNIGLLSEITWLLQSKGDSENSRVLDDQYHELAQSFASLTSLIANRNARSPIDVGGFLESLTELRATTTTFRPYGALFTRLQKMLDEVAELMKIVETGNLESVERALRNFEVLFSGATGVRHVDFIGYRPSKES